MAKQKLVGHSGDETRREFHAVFVDTNLDTHLALLICDADSVYDLKQKVVLEHSKCFPNFGDVSVHALKIKRKGNHYVLSDWMLVTTAFLGVAKDWFILADISEISSQKPGLLLAPLHSNSPHALEYTRGNQNIPTNCLATQQIVNCKTDANFRTSSSDSGRRSGPRGQMGHDLSGQENKVPAVDGESNKNHTKTGTTGGPYTVSDEESFGSGNTGRKKRRKKKVAGHRLITSRADVVGGTYLVHEQAMIISFMDLPSENKTDLETEQILNPVCGGNAIIKIQANETQRITPKEKDGSVNYTKKRKWEVQSTSILPEHDALMGTLAEPAASVEAIDKNLCGDPNRDMIFQVDREGITDNDLAENGTGSVGGSSEASRKIVKKRRKSNDDGVTSSDCLALVDKSGDLDCGIHKTEPSHTNLEIEAFKNSTKPLANEQSVPAFNEMATLVKKPKKGKKAKGSDSEMLDLSQMACASSSVPIEDKTYRSICKDDTNIEVLSSSKKEEQSKLNSDVNILERVEMETDDVVNDDKEHLELSQVHEVERKAKKSGKKAKKQQISTKVPGISGQEGNSTWNLASSKTAKTSLENEAKELDSKSVKNNKIASEHSEPGDACHPGLVGLISTEDKNNYDKPSGVPVKEGCEGGVLGLSYEEVVSKDQQAEIVSASDHLSGKNNVIGGSSNNIKEKGLGEDTGHTEEEVRSVQLPELHGIKDNTMLRKSKSKRKTKNPKAPSSIAENLSDSPLVGERSVNGYRSRDGISHSNSVPTQLTPIHMSEDIKYSEQHKWRSKEQLGSDVGNIAQPLTKNLDAELKPDGSELERSDDVPISESDVRISYAGVGEKPSKRNFIDNDVELFKETDRLQQLNSGKPIRPTKKQQAPCTNNPSKSSQKEQVVKAISDELRPENSVSLPTSESDMKSHSEKRVNCDSVSHIQSESDVPPLTKIHRIEEGNKTKTGKHERKKKKQKSTANHEKLKQQRSVAVPEPESDMKSLNTRIDDKSLRNHSCCDYQNRREAEGLDQRDSESLQLTSAHKTEGIKKNKRKNPKGTENKQESDLSNFQVSSLREQETKDKPDGQELDSSITKENNMPPSGLKPSRFLKDMVVSKPGAHQRKSQDVLAIPGNTDRGNDVEAQFAFQPLSTKAKSDSLELDSSVAKKKSKSSSARQSDLKSSRSSKYTGVPGADQRKSRLHTAQSNNTCGDDLDRDPLSTRSDSLRINSNQGSKIAKQLPVSKLLPLSTGRSSSANLTRTMKNSSQKRSSISGAAMIFSGEGSSSSDEDLAVPKLGAERGMSQVVVHATQSNNTSGDDLDRLDSSRLKSSCGSKIAEQLPLSNLLPLGIGKSKSTNMTRIVKNSSQKNSLIGGAASIFNREGSSSSDEDEDEDENEDGGSIFDDSTKAPSVNASSSDYSEGESQGNWMTSKRVVTMEGKGDAGLNSRSSDQKNLTMASLFKKSSNFKKAKLVASKSQLEDSEPVDFVPDSPEYM